MKSKDLEEKYFGKNIDLKQQHNQKTTIWIILLIKSLKILIGFCSFIQK